MKGRIITNLRGFSGGEGHPDFDKNMAGILERALCIDPATLRERASRTLHHVLHNYSDLNVSTIDRFVHRLIRSFSRDLKLSPDFEVSTDNDEVLQTAVDNLLEKTGSDPELTNLLVEFVKSKIDDEQEWEINSDLKAAGKQIFQEDAGYYLRLLKNHTPEDFVAVRKELNQRKNKFEKELKDLAQKGLEVIDKAGIDHTAFFYVGAVPKYFKALQSEVKQPGSNVLKALTEDKWYSASKAGEVGAEIDSIKPDLEPILQELVELTTGPAYKVYNLTSALVQNLYAIAVIHEIELEVKKVQDDRNLVLVSDFNKLVGDVVANNPAPFIYERIGEKYSNYLIDEFQDTSVLQWQNFLPLFHNALSRQQFTMLVGDGKQAIYRFRNGDVDQFVNLPHLDLPQENPLMHEYAESLDRNYSPQRLASNFRSKEEIVTFNNKFYGAIRQLHPAVASIYEGHEQQATKSEGGYVRVEKMESESNKEDLNNAYLERVLQIVDECLAHGFHQRDIAVITRNNKESILVANELLAAGQDYRVLSAQSLVLQNDPEVQLVMSYIAWLLYPEERATQVKLAEKTAIWKTSEMDADLVMKLAGPEGLNKGKLLELGVDVSNVSQHQTSLTPYELLETVIRMFGLAKKPNVFIEFLLEAAFSYGQKKDNSLHGFLDWWNEKGKSESIKTTEGTDAINVLTIHKSKGLQFPVVIFPFASIGLKGDSEFWIELDNEALPTSRVSLKKKDETPFHHLLEREQDRAFLDNINLLYVATTRPQQRLYMLYGTSSNDQMTKVIEGALQADFENAACVEIGEAQTISSSDAAGESTKGPEEVQLETSGTFDYRKKLRISFQAPFQWDVEAPQKDRDYGNKLHQAMSLIQTSADLEKAIVQLLEEGWIRAGETEEIKQTIEKLLENEPSRNWFADGWQVFTESELLTSKGVVLRPDRIQYNEESCFVIDYKTGVQSPGHARQMRQYVSEVSQVLDRKTKGFLVYFDPWDVVEV